MNTLRASIAAFAVSGILLATPLTTHAQVESQDVYRYRLYADGSISCSGADNTNRNGGQVVAFPFRHGGTRGVYFKFKLRNVEPRASYTIAVSREPNCADAQFYGPVRTNSSGDATFYGFYSTWEGSHNLLFNAATNEGGLENPRFREIGTQNARVFVP